MRLAGIGAGSWGTTVAALGARNATGLALWSRRPELAEALNAFRGNPDHIDGAVLGIQRLFMTDTFRVYTNPDVVGCEIAGVVKNVVALAAGIAQGLGVGDNARAALITRGLAELTRFGLALGGNPLSFLGLAGIGDIFVTCSSPNSRNRSVGEALGRGRPLADVLGEMTMVAEGVRSTAAVL